MTNEEVLQPAEDLWFDGYWLRHLREEKGHTQKELGRTIAVMLGRPRPFCGVAVHNWETNKREPSTSVLIALCRIYSVPARYFANGPAPVPDQGGLPAHEGWLEVIKEISEALSRAVSPTRNGRVYRPTERLVTAHNDILAGWEGAKRILARIRRPVE